MKKITMKQGKEKKMTLGEKIVSLRKKQKLSQEDLAGYLGVTR